MEKFNSSNTVAGLDEYASNAELASVELFQDYPVPVLKFASVCCILFMVIGIPGNLITIIALTRYKQIRNATAIFIIHLSTVDLIFCCSVLPIVSTSYWTRSWVHGKLICHLFPFINYVLVIASLFTVLAITINRNILICHPSLYVKLYTAKKIAIMIAMIWIFAFILLLMPYFELWGRFSLDQHVGACTIVPDASNRSPKKFIVMFSFTFACATLLLCYARIIWVVRKTTSKRNTGNRTRFQMQSVNINTSDQIAQIVSANISSGSPSSSSGTQSTDDELDKCCTEIDLTSRCENIERSRIKSNKNSKARKPKVLPSKRDKRLRMMVLAIMICFCVCYFPITLTKILYKKFNTYPVANILGYLMIYFTPCVNPILYVILSKEYQLAYKSVFRYKQR